MKFRIILAVVFVWLAIGRTPLSAATLNLTGLADSGSGTLREVIGAAVFAHEDVIVEANDLSISVFRVVPYRTGHEPGNADTGDFLGFYNFLSI